MDFQEYLQVLRKNLLWVLCVVFLVTCLFLGYAKKAQERYSVSVDFTVSVEAKQGNGEYQYDGYYAMMSSDFVAKTVFSWFKTPSVILSIYDNAGLPRPEVNSINFLTRFFKPVQYSAQNVVVRFISEDRKQAEKLAFSLIQIIEDKARTLNLDEQGRSVFSVKGAQPVIIRVQKSALLYSAVGFFFSLFLVLLFLPLWSSFKKSRLRDGESC